MLHFVLWDTPVCQIVLVGGMAVLCELHLWQLQVANSSVTEAQTGTLRKLTGVSTSPSLSPSSFHVLHVSHNPNPRRRRLVRDPRILYMVLGQPRGCGSKIGAQNRTSASGNMD